MYKPTEPHSFGIQSSANTPKCCRVGFAWGEWGKTVEINSSDRTDGANGGIPVK